MKTAALRLVLIVALSMPALSAADPILEWNAVALSAVLAARQLPPDGARSMALVHVALFDAVNAVDHRYPAYAYKGPAPSGASAEAAAVAAASSVLLTLFPDQATTVEAAYAASLAKLPDGAEKVAGIALGTEAAASCLTMRRGDGAGSVAPYRPRTAAGVYVPTALPVSGEWSKVKPWLMRESAQFRPGPPPRLDGSTWARDYNEIWSMGGKQSQSRSAAQTEIARFWILTGPASWMLIVRSLAASKPAALVEQARLFALVNMAASDAFVAVFDAKYTYNFWRPLTAIRNGDIDGNDATALDPDWLPLIDTPLHPEYPCAHCIVAGAVGEVLEGRFGRDEVATITMSSPTSPGVPHQWKRISDYVREVASARVWGGVHYRNSAEVGEAMGRKIGKLASQAQAGTNTGLGAAQDHVASTP